MLTSVPKEEGRRPLRLFTGTRRYTRDDNCPKLDGMVPVNMLLPRDKYVHVRIEPNDVGIVPTKLFILKSSNVTLVRPPRHDGMDPVRPKPESCNAVITPFVHVTPLQTDAPPQIEEVGEYDDVHDQLE
jgi:hypothetical protein